MHFAYKVSATELGQRKGCLYYDLGCRGPMTHSPCNRILWNEFPFHDLAPGTVFKTQTVRGVPSELPAGIDKPGYIRLTAAAKATSPSWTEDDIFVA
jgi:hydrogenase small subunit